MENAYIGGVFVLCDWSGAVWTPGEAAQAQDRASETKKKRKTSEEEKQEVEILKRWEVEAISETVQKDKFKVRNSFLLKCQSETYSLKTVSSAGTKTWRATRRCEVFD